MCKFYCCVHWNFQIMILTIHRHGIVSLNFLSNLDGDQTWWCGESSLLSNCTTEAMMVQISSCSWYNLSWAYLLLLWAHTHTNTSKLRFTTLYNLSNHTRQLLHRQTKRRQNTSKCKMRRSQIINIIYLSKSKQRISSNLKYYLNCLRKIVNYIGSNTVVVKIIFKG